jgi:hypothetical protein
MDMANVLTVVWLVIGWIVSQTSILVWASLMLPDRVQRARERVESRPVVCFFFGLLVFVLTLVIATNLIKEGRPGHLQLFGWIFMGPMLAAGIIGGASIARIAADRIYAHSNAESTLPSMIGGALCTTASGFVPIVGWFLYFPVTGFISIGAGAMALLQRRKRPVIDHAPIMDAAVAGETGHSIYSVPERLNA